MRTTSELNFETYFIAKPIWEVGDNQRIAVKALFGPSHFLSPDQQSGIHCLIICAIQQLTLNNVVGS